MAFPRNITRLPAAWAYGSFVFPPTACPSVERRDDGLYVSCFDTSLGEMAEFRADRVVLSSAMVPNDTSRPRTHIQASPDPRRILSRGPHEIETDRFRRRRVLYGRNVPFAEKYQRDDSAGARARQARALTTLARDSITVDAMVARIDREVCAACLTCVRTCPFGVPFINDEGKAEIDASKCKGCGTCAAECPAKAIDLMHSRDMTDIGKGEGGNQKVKQ